MIILGMQVVIPYIPPLVFTYGHAYKMGSIKSYFYRYI
jgi:hypothetical protein